MVNRERRRVKEAEEGSDGRVNTWRGGGLRRKGRGVEKLGKNNKLYQV